MGEPDFSSGGTAIEPTPDFSGGGEPAGLDFSGEGEPVTAATVPDWLQPVKARGRTSLEPFAPGESLEKSSPAPPPSPPGEGEQPEQTAIDPTFPKVTHRLLVGSALAAARDSIEGRYEEELKNAYEPDQENAILDAKAEELFQLGKVAKAAGLPMPAADLSENVDAWRKALGTLGVTDWQAKKALGGTVGEPAAAAIGGLQRAGASVPQFTLSPEGAATLPLMSEKIVGAPVAKWASRLFVGDMLRQAPGQIKEGWDALQRRDYGTAAQALGGLTLTGMLAGHQVKGEAGQLGRRRDQAQEAAAEEALTAAARKAWEGLQARARETRAADGRVSEFGGESGVLPPPSGQAGVENAPPGATGEVVLPAEGAKTGEPLDFSAGGVAVETSEGAAHAGPSRIVEQELQGRMDRREEIPASLLEQYNQASETPWALPEGYARRGEAWTFTEPVKPERPEARMQRERVEASAGIREAKAAETPSTNIQAPENDQATNFKATERAEAGTPLPLGERPPDILDWIGDNFPRGVKVSSKADYGEHLAAARGRAKELMSVAKGEPVDEVIRELQGQGMYRRIESPDDLLGAMNAAAEARKGWAEQNALGRKVDEPAAENPDWSVEGWLDKAIEATRPDGSMMMEGLTGAPIWLAKGGAHAALQVVRVAMRAGKKLGEAIQAAIEHVRGMNLPGFHEGQLREWLSSYAERETGQKILDSTVVSDAAKTAVSEYLYQRRTNATDQELADGILRSPGSGVQSPESGPASLAQIEAAWKVWQDPPAAMPGAVRSKLLGSITRGLAEAERVARAAGDTEKADAIAKRAGEMWDEALPQITDLAQSMQALNDLVDLSPDGQVARMRRQLERAADETVDRHRAETTVMQGALEEGRREGVQAVRQDPAVNGAARAAVDAAVEQAPEVHQAVVMELAEPWAELSQHAPELLTQARELVRARANELLDRTPRPPGLTAAQHARRIMDDLAGRAAQIFAGHIQGAEPGLGLVEKLQQRLGLTRGRAVDLGTALSREWERQLKAAQAQLPKRIARQRVARDRAAGTAPLPVNAPDGMVEQAIRGQLRQLNVKLGEVLQQEAGRQARTEAHVAERIVQASGLEGAAADTLRNVLKQRWDALVTAAQVRRLEQLQRATGVKVSPKLKSAFEKLVALDRLGALTSDRFYDVVKDTLKLKRLKAADATELRRLAQRAQELPEGYLRQQAAAEVLKFTERLSGNTSLKDLPLAIFYANILSGFTTPAKIVLENLNLLAAHTVTAFLSRPGELLHPADFVRTLAHSYKAGLAKGALQAGSTLRTGTVTGVWPAPRTPTILEMKPFGAKLDVLNFWKWFSRGISTAHETTFKPAWELKQTLLARDVARREGLAGVMLQKRVADLMADTAGHWEKARAQALSELQAAGKADRLNLARRTREILEQQRETNLPGSTEAARDFALRTAYLNEPYGLMGVVAMGVRSVLEKARKEFPVLGTGVKTQIPFTTVVANILNEKLNWTPVGLGRAVMSQKTGKLYGREILDPSERADLYAKAIVGTIALGAMGTLFGDKIHGNGPSDPAKRKQLQAAGWVPHSIQLGDRYFSYMNTPAGVGLAVIGNVKDWHRYGKGDEADAVNRMSFAFKATLNAIISQGMLDSLKRVFEGVGSESTTEGAEKLEKLAARTASSFVFPNLLQQVDRLFDPTLYDKTGMEALLRSQVPFVRRENKPALTVLGDEIHVGPFAYWAGKVTSDPLVRTLAEKQAWVPEPGRNQIIGDKPRGPDHFRAMTPDEFYDFVAISGRAIRERLSENLDVIAGSEPDKARDFVRKVAEQERAIAKKNFE